MASSDEGENGDIELSEEREEKIGLFLAETILELEEENQVKVKEHFDVDLEVDFGIAIGIVLHVESVTPRVVDTFISEFNNNGLILDPTLYSFQTKAGDTSEPD